MALLSLIPDFPGLQIDDIDNADDLITIYAHSIAPSACCPVCGQVSSSVHSCYARHPADLPSSGKRVRLVATVRRFFCLNPDCQRKIFVERLSALLDVHAQRTRRLDKTLSVQVRAMSAEKGSRALKQMAMPVSGDTLLRILRRLSLTERPTPRVLGVDDWAYRKGQNYGTILCDLERHCTVDLLPDRSADSLAAWLRMHPGVEIISRDRSKIYAEGATRGAPKAIQVVDRWHLLKNVGDTVQAVLEHYRSYLLKGPLLAQASETVPAPTPSAGGVSKAEKTRLSNAARRRARYDQIITLNQQGLPQATIAERVGVTTRTVSRFVNAPSFPERKRRRSDDGIMAPFLAELCRHFEEGCHNASKLWRKLKESGFTGSYGTVRNVVARLQQGLPASKPPRASQAPQARRYAPREAKYLFTQCPDKLKEQEVNDLSNMLKHEQLAKLYNLAQDFAEMVREQLHERFDNWLTQATVSDFSALRSFARGLQHDYAEVKAALMLPFSNGQTEGQVNRLKLAKREMYGRAKFDLLRQRVLQPI
jgi:transposase